MMSSRLRWLIVVQLLLSDQVLGRSTLRGQQEEVRARLHGDAEQDPPLELAPQRQSDASPTERSDPPSGVTQTDERTRSARLMTSILRTKLQEKLQIQSRVHVRGNVSCAELLSASAVDDPLSSAFPQELLGLSLVPVLVAVGCPQEAQTLVMKLYELLGVAETDELLMQVEGLIEGRMRSSGRGPSSEGEEAGQHMEAVMFNIQQLALVAGGGTSQRDGHCEGWSRVNGTMLVGTAVGGATGGLEDAVRTCEGLGVLCAGVTSTGPLTPGLYQAVLKRGSRILPCESTESETWIRQCSADVWTAASGGRMKRSPQRACINKSEERVYNVVEWIPAVSTLYNLGTAVYYASVNCSETAKERAILSAVDLGTDALMVATGGTAGVAGYALGAGVKTGVKAGVRYLLNTMKEEDDVLVNQVSREEGMFTIQ